MTHKSFWRAKSPAISFWLNCAPFVPAFERDGVVHMALFGSRARGDNRPDSDVDLLVDVMPGRKFSLLDLIGVGHLVEDHVGLRGDVLMRAGLGKTFAEGARRDVVEVF